MFRSLALLFAACVCVGTMQGIITRKKTNNGSAQAQSTLTKALNNLEEYERAAKSTRPTVIIFNSDTCEACTLMEPCTEAAAQAYPSVDFYCINAKAEAFKDLKSKVKIEAYPTTHFIKDGAQKRTERGSLSKSEMDTIVYELVHGRKKPIEKTPTPAQPAEKIPTQQS